MHEHEYEEELSFAPVASLDVDARRTFVRKTYAHLLGAIFVFTLIEVVIFKMGWAQTIAKSLLGVNWLFVLGGFIIISWLASKWAHQAESQMVQYLSLILFTVAEAIIFVPLLFIANYFAPGIIQSAAAITMVGFVGLSVIAIASKKDFSFLGGLLQWGMMAALLLIVGGVIFGFNLGLYFSVGMVVIAGIAILYDTSNIINNYPENRYVAAALELFASVALLFWYVIRIFLLSRD